ncbi:MAG: amino acid ABC transporter substrate-binding protein [Anaerovibrio sp.]|nr:amino acid ABC transporter substrate-binding protein [Selenomonadaceae bacterium]MDY6054008.1 amino acid ABC transporter substrate-binding protein [Anaerovibrio sp.]
MKMRKLLALGLGIVFAIGAVAGCGNQAAEKPAKETKAIVVGLDDNYPPMGFKNENNEIDGFDIDVAKEAAKRLGRPVEFKAIDWDSKEAELKSGRVDVLWNGLDITEKRKENMMFSDPYMDNRQIVFVQKGKAATVTKPEDLAGKIVGTQSGGTAEEYIDANDSFKKSMKDVKKYSDYISAFMDLETGRLDAIVCDEITGRYYMSKHPEKLEGLEVVVGPVSSFGIGFRKDDQALHDEIQKVLNEMKKDGTMAKISEKWFAKDITK